MRLLRALFRGGALQIGALDPRLSAATMAQKVGAPRSTVQARLAHWRDTGFFAKSDVWPNPGLFGVGTGGIGIEVPDARAKPAVLRDLRLVDGVLGYFDHLGPFVALQVVDDSPAASARRLELISRLPGASTRPTGHFGRSRRGHLAPERGSRLGQAVSKSDNTTSAYNQQMPE